MRALFLGGPFDMTTMQVTNEIQHFSFFEPEGSWTSAKAEPVPCKVLTYELVTKTRKGVLIYEFVGD